MSKVHNCIFTTRIKDKLTGLKLQMCYLMFNQNNCRWRDMDNKQMCDEIQSDFNEQICEVIMHLYYTEVRLIILWFLKLNAAYRICLQKVYNLYWIAKAVTSKQTLMIQEVKNNKSKSIKRLIQSTIVDGKYNLQLLDTNVEYTKTRI